MTQMLASVRSRDEARAMMGAGADIIDLKEPADGVLGALAAPVVREIVADVSGRRPVSATVGELGPERLGAAIRAMADAGVDVVKVGLFDQSDCTRLMRALTEVADIGIRIVLVLFAEKGGQRIDLDAVAAAGISGVMMDTAEKLSGSLLRKVPRGELDGFVRGARRRGLASGLAGALGAEDVPELLTLEPDYLGFRGALCKGGGREQRVCIRRAQMIRALISGPVREDSPAHFGS